MNPCGGEHPRGDKRACEVPETRTCADPPVWGSEVLGAGGRWPAGGHFQLGHRKGSQNGNGLVGRQPQPG